MPNPSTGTGPGFDTPLPAGGANAPTPQRGQPGSATELRRQRQSILDQIQKIENNPDVAADPTSGTGAQLSTKQQTAVDSLYQQVTTLSKDIQDFESAPAKAPSVRENVNPGPDVPYIQTLNPDGTLTVQANANYTGQIKPTVEHIGNHDVVITPPTADERAAGQTQPHVTVAYTDTDAQALADRQTAVAESNAAVAVANQKLNALVDQTKMEIDKAVAAGQDAASIRASRALDIQQAHDQAANAIAQAQVAQSALTEYNNNRHAQAQEQLTQQQIDDTRAQQQAQDALTQRGQDISAQNTQYTTQAGQANARLSAGAGYMGNALSNIENINKDLPPGSALGGPALASLMAAGQGFFSNLGGLTTPTAPPLPPSISPTYPTTPGAPVAPTVTTTPGVQSAAPPTPAVMPPSGGPAGGLDWLFGSAASPIANAANTPPPSSLSPDGTPMASVADVARAFGRPVPAMAVGGVVTRPTVALIGERGPEAVVPLSRPLPRPGRPVVRRLPGFATVRPGLQNRPLAAGV